MTADKSYLRKVGLIKRRTLAPHDHAEASRLACQTLVRFIRELSAKSCSVAGYAPIKAEIDIIPALRTITGLGYSTLLPVMFPETKQLQFYAWRTGDGITRNTYGISEPTARSNAVHPAILLVPLLAFDRTGQRLGYGAGYYDITLKKLRDSGRETLAIGVGFSVQEEKTLPKDTFDQPLDAIVTEKEIIKISV